MTTPALGFPSMQHMSSQRTRGVDIGGFFVPPASRNPPSEARFVPNASMLNAVNSSPTTQSIIQRTHSNNRLVELQNSAQTLTPPFHSTSHTYRAPPRVPSSIIDLPHAPPIASGIELISPRDVLPDRFRVIFPYELFNAVQSKCFSPIYESNDNMVVAAPTGSGKTVLLELAICKLVAVRGNENFKIVYQAPTKALCSERAQDWGKKFGHMNLRVAELTGDTSQLEMKRVGSASIIVTTPEKWDSVTRKWHDHRKLLEMVELFLVDEVHILKDVRGATLEAVVSRMKTIGANVRFVALSATVPNSEDIAKWLGRDHTNPQVPARRETFGEDLRPVKLQKWVYGYDVNGNDFVFDSFLDKKLPMLLRQHSRMKPVLIFCMTRKICESTARILAETWSVEPPGDKTWKAPTTRLAVISRDLQEIVHYGVAFHHAGLDADDRNAVAQYFLDGQIGVICCTSTLAVGINLPCHTVVLKGTACFQDGKMVELADLEVMQMLGRAGRPQFDNSAVAIILTRNQNKERYEKMVSGQQILESTLHLNLIEHLNSEVGLGTIRDLSSAKAWLSGTFLSVRLRRNPGYYQLTGTTPSRAQQTDERLEQICEKDVRLLQEVGLLTDGETFNCTDYGRAMSKYMVHFDTMKLILKIPHGVGMQELLHALCQAVEFRDLRFKPNERTLFRELNKSPFILYPINETVTSTAHKVSLLVQTELGVIEYPNSREFLAIRRQLLMEKKLVFDRMHRLVRCIIDCKGCDRDAVGVRTGLDLARALSAEAWDGRPSQLRQVPGIGPVGMRKLVQADIRTVHQLSEKDHDDIERILTHNPPFGKKMKDKLTSFPHLTLEAGIISQTKPASGQQGSPTIKVSAILSYTNAKCPIWGDGLHTLTFTAETASGTLAHFWRGSLKRLRKDDGHGLELLFSVQLEDFDDYIVCCFACEDVVGTVVSRTLQHSLPVSAFAAKTSRQPVSRSQRTSRRNPQDLGDGDIDDEDLLAAEHALNATSPSLQGTNNVVDEYPMVNDLMIAEPPMTNSQAIQEPLREPIRLPNGKWRCWHICSNGAPTASGKQCAHKCCREGLDKPRKAPEAKRANKRTSEDRDTATPVQSTQRSNDSMAKRQKGNPSRELGTPRPFLPPSVTPRSSRRISLDDFDLDDDIVDLTHLDDDATTLSRPSSSIPKLMSSEDDGSRLGCLGENSSLESTLEVDPIEGEDDDIHIPDDAAVSGPHGPTVYNVVDGTEHEVPTEVNFGYDSSENIAFAGRQTGDVGVADPLEDGDNKATASQTIRAACRLLDLTSSPPKGESHGDIVNEDPAGKEQENMSLDFDDGEAYASDHCDWYGEIRGNGTNEVDRIDLSAGSPEQTPKSSDEETPQAVMETKDYNMLNGMLDGQTGKSKEEPAWVGEFDEDFIATFRPFVNFI
ncbi:p-loop containing nucleoside triphosphate hydrolase protein [Pleurostoma richardsiae]|uniref:DNA 3'-5' helicase n=1 Tax=Pleurostoma richardsiae TaxID=41990 RepID=A0AA38REL7_9PEZI|nr:p-loop containing nucleoside triphosphate hydrolase protein [Pleurostoma richardsiae]